MKGLEEWKEVVEKQMYEYWHYSQILEILADWEQSDGWKREVLWEEPGRYRIVREKPVE